MFKLEGELKNKVEERLKNEQVIWLTTVSQDGRPQPTPVWFLWENGAFIIYSQPNTHKVANIQNNPNVALALNCDEWGGNVAVFTGKAQIDPNAPLAHQNPAYAEKYREGIKNIEMTPESLGNSYNVPIRIKPDRVRAF